MAEIRVSSFGQRQTGLGAVTDEAAAAYGRILLAIVGADGEVTEPEFDWLVAHQRSFGVPEHVIDGYAAFDHRSADLDSLLDALDVDVDGWRPGPTLIYHAIQMAGADGDYADAERAKVNVAARRLGVPDDVVAVLHHMVIAETALDAMRTVLFHTAPAPGG
ncbi:hypothetical protein [Actinomadura sp. NEAU-AAG7]|uniref:hypothetical protein n=1 Tax=Actinomadura sp. NEAU-AAG7 TaxID=2839640 RepID=UPI001BE3DC65|nr:hypothetical protein [Actinomadura sp. NEAU-AAG7]MBT2210765.1 hypothetical protein [Actinomadura sp. NEAU-AAG7]